MQARFFLILVLAFFAPVIWAENINLPNMGEKSSLVLSPLEEKRLGEQIMRTLKRHYFFVEDPEVTEYFSNLGYRLASELNQLDHKYAFHVMREPAINALALPGGNIVVHSGLIRAAQDENELASVVAHEIVHISQGHINRALERGNLANMSALAGFIGAIILAGQNPELGQAMLSATYAGLIQMQINFTRENEQEADRIGIDLLTRSGFDPMGMPQFFERLQQATRIYGQELPEFLRTHPVTTARIADARNRVETLNYRKKTKSQLEFYLIQAKLRLIADSSIENEKYFHALLEDKLSKSQLIATKYGYAMALLDNKKALQAKSIMLELLQQASNNLIFVTALARIAWETNAQGEAITILKKALALNPNNHILVLNLADYYLQRDEAKYALPFLRTHMRHHAETPYLYHLLSRAEGATGSLSAAHRARAEYFYLNGQTFAAIEQLKIAKDLRNINEYQRLKIETRLKQLEEIALQEKQI